MTPDAIRLLLNARLAAMPALPPVAWEGAQFKPPADGATYLRTALLPAPTLNPTLTERLRRDRGIYQVLVNCPDGAGPTQADRLARDVQAWFSAGMRVGALRIRGTPVIAAPIPSDAMRRVVPVSIAYEAIE